jgi:hypothetical protein
MPVSMKATSQAQPDVLETYTRTISTMSQVLDVAASLARPGWKHDAPSRAHRR